MTKWSLGYELLRYYVRFVFKLFYKKVQSVGKENIPQKKPIIFAANHQNALMDPLAIIFTNPRQSVFLTRADIFNNPILLKIFTAFKMLPVYRIRDGADSLKNNERIFNKSVEILEAKMSVALFPEATHTDKRRMRPLKKAVPRIAFLAEESNNFELDLQIVPVGIYYEDYIHSNSNLFVNYGKAITLKKYKELYAEAPPKAYNAFRKELEEAIKPLIIHIEDEKHYSLYENIRLFYRARMRSKLNLNTETPLNNFKADKATIAKIENYFSNDENNIENLEHEFAELKRYSTLLKIPTNNFTHPNAPIIFSKALLFLLAFPIYFYALVNHIIYYQLSMKFIHKIKDQQFYSSFKFGISIIIAPLLYLINSGIFYFFSRNIDWTIIYFFSLPISAFFANKYRYLWKDFQEQLHICKGKKKNKKIYSLFKEKQEQLIERLDQLTN